MFDSFTSVFYQTGESMNLICFAKRRILAEDRINPSALFAVFQEP